MSRLPDWPARLSALVAESCAREFRYGERDCCLWAADAVLAVTGVDPAADLRGTYSSQQQAAQVLHAAGGLRGVAARAGKSIRPLMAKAGDVGIVRYAGKPMLAVCQGAMWLCAAPSGLVAAPLKDAVMAWEV